jgi:hypothetical protein
MAAGLRGEELVGDVSRAHAPGYDLEGPPGFVQMVAHPLRWRLLRELTTSERAVWELTERLQTPQNLVSHHPSLVAARLRH